MAHLRGFPIRIDGDTKYTMGDIRVADGRLGHMDGDVVALGGVQALAQRIETAILRSPAIEAYEREVRDRHRRTLRMGGWIGEAFADLPPPPHFEPPTLDAIRGRLVTLAESMEGRYFTEVSSVRVLSETDVEVEFSAVGYPGSYIRRVHLLGPEGVYDCVPVEKQTLVTVQTIDDALLAALAMRPTDAFQLSDRKFEELVARIIEDMGYEVTLTRLVNDGGVDIFAVLRGPLHPTLTVIDCKRYRADRKIGVGMVRTIAGLREQYEANTGMLVTTSSFSKPARDLQIERFKHSVALADMDRLAGWLSRYGWDRSSAGVYFPGAVGSSTRTAST
ncbi:MAG: restriction endonuclease [Alphaproteobacteria bacterium]|nr:restriction endonuclease [Alphaproteobacteria bacterium]